MRDSGGATRGGPVIRFPEKSAATKDRIRRDARARAAREGRPYIDPFSIPEKRATKTVTRQGDMANPAQDQARTPAGPAWPEETPVGGGGGDPYGGALAEYAALLNSMAPGAFDEAPYLTAIAQANQTAEAAKPVLAQAFLQARTGTEASVNEALTAQAGTQKAFEKDAAAQQAGLAQQSQASGALMAALGGGAGEVQAARGTTAAPSELLAAITTDQAASAASGENLAEQQGARAVEGTYAGEAAGLAQNQANLTNILNAIGLKRTQDKSAYDQAAQQFESEKAMRLFEYQQQLDAAAAEEAARQEENAREDTKWAAEFDAKYGPNSAANAMTGQQFINAAIRPSMGPNERLIFESIVNAAPDAKTAKETVATSAGEIRDGKFSVVEGQEPVTGIGVDPAKIAKWLDIYYNGTKQSAQQWASTGVMEGTWGRLPRSREPNRDRGRSSNTDGVGAIAHNASRLGRSFGRALISTRGVTNLF